MSYDSWKTTPPDEDRLPEGWYFCRACADRGDGGAYEDDEPCGCCCKQCGEPECVCNDIPEACEAWREDRA